MFSQWLVGQIMTEKTKTVEFADKTVERAIEAACRHFNVDDKEKLNVTLVTRGSTGLFGLGGRKAKIRVSLKDVDTAAQHPEEALSESRESEDAGVEETATPEHDEADRVTDRDSTGHDVPAAEEYVQARDDEMESGGETAEEEGVSEQAESEELSDEMLERLEKARVFTAQLLDKAGLESIVQVNTDAANPFLDISGEDLSLIIGKDGRTLDAIEYIVNLNLKRADEKSGKRIPVDAQGYRAKREEGLRRTAEKLALKVKKTRRSVAMSPMNSRERRVVHMAVKGIHGVRTHSTGDGRLRKVIITSVRKGENNRRQGKRHNRR